MCFILDPPEVEIKNISPVSEAKEGDKMILECLVKRSNPKAYSYSWYKDNIILHDYKTQYHKTLVRGDKGSYSCEAVNGVGSSKRSQSVWIRVQRECHKRLIYICHSSYSLTSQLTKTTVNFQMVQRSQTFAQLKLR